MAISSAIFLDKDGTLLENLPYNVDPSRMRFTPGARAGLRRLAHLDIPLIVISNQPGVALGLFPELALADVRNHLARMFAEVGARLAGFYYCAHHPEGRLPRLRTRCPCRKPAPGMLLDAAARHGVKLERSWMIGDILDDIEAGQRAGCETILLNNGNETHWQGGQYRIPHHVVNDLDQASHLIYERDITENAARGWMQDAV